MLDYAVHLGLLLSDQAREKRLIRKSDSLSVVLKSLLLKVIPILTTIILAIKATRLPTWPSLSFGVATCVAMGMATYFVSVPLAKETQARKASRDDKVEMNSSEAHEAQAHYTASTKTKARYRSAWQVFLFIGIVLIFLFLADEGSMVIWLRLGHQFLSIDETYDKFAQSYPKVTPILKAMRSGPGILHCLFLASERVWTATPMPLGQVEWAWKSHSPPGTATQPSPLQSKYASDAV
ncbi:hypothetical protein MRS44_013971 [Fusarium solani]|uniref:uncharacterized protein n=1 Tax=Fusarium solani TaxID=169388 RepID=UPI0032C46BAF|nr:hypothetical protein MRS44_013971 [Fusarium solani]